jgi:SOS-response transcriptional repressor LexA
MNCAEYEGLTPRQVETLKAVVSLRASLGRSPNLTELAGELSLKTRSSAWRLINELEKRGYVRRQRSPFSIALFDRDATSPLSCALQAKLDAYCRLHGEEAAAVIADAVALFLDERERDLKIAEEMTAS